MIKRSKGIVTTSVDFAPRVGEGFVVESSPQHTLELDGSSSLSIGVDLSKLPAPDRRYVADICGAIRRHGGWQFLFGQEKIGDGELRTLLVIGISAVAMQTFVAQSMEMKNPSLEEIARLLDFEVEGPAEITSEPKETVSLRSNVISVAVSGEDAAMDFFSISPFSAHALQRGGKAQVAPVVRVELQTAQLMGLVRHMQTELQLDGREHERI